ncbi:DUF4833 domain-containing protein [Pedobacter sp. GR22-6]|uniref:DUF4833 domain-containing protein n=1 Tax=Pedobacter sp. GR22-6 TaxID=3127957 RepID=UPI00307F0366
MTNLSFPLLKRVLIIIILFIGFCDVSVFAQTADKSDPSPLKFPVPKGISNQLFYLQRDPNTNTIICELNVDKNGVVDRKEPILVYWLRYAEKGEQEDLSYIQRKFAYGIQTKELAKDQFELRFVSHKKLPMYLQRGEDKKFHVFVTVNQKKVQIERIFVRIEGGSFWLPNVKYVEIKGVNTENDAVVTERIKV